MGKVRKLVEELNTLPASEHKKLFASIDLVSPRYLNVQGFNPRGNVETDVNFQRSFNAFYQVRRNAAWRKHFYCLFAQLRKPSMGKHRNFQYILNELHVRTGMWEYSFSTKLLHTLDPMQPIIDKRVLTLLCLPKKNWKTTEPFLEHYREVAQSIAYLAKKTKRLLRDFDRTLPHLKHISVTKKLDLILWRYRREL
ncbi:MAG: hypothetical protein A2942_04940 [Candidatus Lloydbacteria bacterium RIFCSPLOWO2_01_FULL_50_20]|uniref:Uncharacterized protein n=1 Tax=Candidatus Lloydbacteria bacterium RIFCSPLOWO2_01_FULL_50_20 TaxID=1798665 RepID=A0A1G2DDV1_9BACT|nr:MAG: hypothetical protein A2942_04940 [Candidatus Lloydbacteria bacterium RIFCSPLOWO2_01_FULL_50_20]